MRRAIPVCTTALALLLALRNQAAFLFAAPASLPPQATAENASTGFLPNESEWQIGLLCSNDPWDLTDPRGLSDIDVYVTRDTFTETATFGKLNAGLFFPLAGYKTVLLFAMLHLAPAKPVAISAQAKEQRRAAAILLNHSLDGRTRHVAFLKELRYVKEGGGEFHVAADSLLILAEGDFQFFVTEFTRAGDSSFAAWLDEIDAASFTSPYLYDDLRGMESRRKRLINRLSALRLPAKQAVVFRDRLVQRLREIHVRRID